MTSSHRIQSRRVSLILSVTLLALSAPACLKTRAQLREEAASGPEPIEGEVSPVQGGGYAIEEIKSEITRLTGRIDDVERKAARSEGENAATGPGSVTGDLAALKVRVIELEQAQAAMLEAIKKLETRGPEKSGPPAASLFEEGRKSYEAGKLTNAIEILTKYLKTPKPEREESALFLRGEAYFRLKKYKLAIIDYSQFPEKFTKSDRLPKALFKIGLSFDAIGMKNDATPFYQELADRFPKSEEGKSAKKKLIGRK